MIVRLNGPLVCKSVSIIRVSGGLRVHRERSRNVPGTFWERSRNVIFFFAVFNIANKKKIRREISQTRFRKDFLSIKLEVSEATCLSKNRKIEKFDDYQDKFGENKKNSELVE